MLALAIAMTLAQPASADLAFLDKVAAGIEALKAEHPQLKAFEAATALDRSRLVLSYSFHTHRATHRGGWSSGVPNPDDDGIWFLIDVHDRASTSQLHTQPVVERLTLGKKLVMLLVLEGKATTPVGGKLRALLLASGAKAGRE